MAPRRPASPGIVVLLAAVGALLAGGAGAATYVAVTRYLQDQPTNDAGTHPTGGTTPSTTASSTGAAEPCPTFTISAVRAKGGQGDLTQVLYVEGTSPGHDGAEAWICRDSDGTLYYQGHDETGQPIAAATSDFTILIGGRVIGSVSLDGSTYVATNPGTTGGGVTTYRVSRTEFAVVRPDGGRTDFHITKVLPQQ